MRFDLPIEGAWDAMNQVCRRALGLPVDDPRAVYAFRGLSHAAWEISAGLAKLFPHKRTIAYWLDEGTLFEDLAARLSSDGATACAFDSVQAVDPAAWLEPIKKDLLLTLESLDDAVSGEPLAFPAIDAALKDSRTFRVRVSHSLHRSVELSPAPFEAVVVSVDRELAIAICGARVKFDPSVASRLPWAELDSGVEAAEAALRERIGRRTPEEVERDSALLRAFRAALPAGAKPGVRAPLAAAESTDRAVFYFDDVDGASAIERAGLAPEITLPAPGREGLIEAGSGCRWAGPRTLEPYAKARGLDARSVRGLVAVSPAALRLAPDLAARLTIGRAKALADQSGSD